MMNCASEKSGSRSMHLKMALLAMVGVVVQGGLVMLLWNWLLPVIFSGAQQINWLQAMGILLLSKILFGGLRGGCPGLWRHHHQHWSSMTPAERKQMQDRFKGHGDHCRTPNGGNDTASKNAVPQDE